MICRVCGGEMKLLLTSYYCPKDCDKKPTARPIACYTFYSTKLTSDERNRNPGSLAIVPTKEGAIKLVPFMNLHKFVHRALEAKGRRALTAVERDAVVSRHGIPKELIDDSGLEIADETLTAAWDEDLDG